MVLFGVSQVVIGYLSLKLLQSTSEYIETEDGRSNPDDQKYPIRSGPFGPYRESTGDGCDRYERDEDEQYQWSEWLGDAIGGVPGGGSAGDGDRLGRAIGVGTEESRGPMPTDGSGRGGKRVELGELAGDKLKEGGQGAYEPPPGGLGGDGNEEPSRTGGHQPDLSSDDQHEFRGGYREEPTSQSDGLDRLPPTEPSCTH